MAYSAVKKMEGKKFGRWTVLEYAGQNKRHSATWLCQCECGNQKIVDGNCLRKGTSKSCGCWNDEVRRGEHGVPNRTTHGLCGTRIYRIWKAMRTRCSNPNISYANSWFGKGISVCKEWEDPKVFCDWAIKNGYNDTLSIERIDNSKDYCPENCKWIPLKDQAKNTSNCRFITIDGETHILHDWCIIKNIPYNFVNRHEKKGESIEDILTGKVVYKPRKRG